MFTLVICLLSGCGGRHVKIAAVASLSGDNAGLGKQVAQGAQAAVADWNRRGGIGGKTVSLELYDDRGAPESAAAVARRISTMRFAGVIGHVTSECSMAASIIYSEHKMVMITPSATNPMITDRQLPYIYRLCGRDDQQGLALAQFANGRKDAPRIIVIHDRSTYGQGLCDMFMRGLSDPNRVVLYTTLDPAATEHSELVKRISDLDADIVMFGGIYVQGGQLLSQLRRTGSDCCFLSGDGCYDNGFTGIVGTGESNTYVTFTARQPGAKPSGTTTPSPLFDAGYESADVLLTAVSRSGSADSGDLVAALSQGTFPCRGGGNIRFDSKGDEVDQPYILYKLTEGRFVPLEPLPLPWEDDPLYVKQISPYFRPPVANNKG